jgi:hypothetical protein
MGILHKTFILLVKLNIRKRIIGQMIYDLKLMKYFPYAGLKGAEN